MTLKYIPSHSIPNGTKFVALYSDGSGAALFFIDDNGDLYNANGVFYSSSPDCFLMDAGYGGWIELPKSFELWFEKKGEQRE